jgi:outer membrane protein TolC
MRQLLLCVTLISLALPAQAQKKSGGRPPDVVSLSLERFTDIALRNSLRSVIYRNSAKSADISYRSSYRSSRFPQISLQASGDRSYSHSAYELGVLTATGTPTTILSQSETYGTQGSVGASLNLPLYITGGAFSMGITQSQSVYNTAGSPPSTTEISPSWQASYTQPLFIFVGDTGRRNWRRTQLGHETSLASLDHEKLAIWVDARALYYRTIQQQSMVEVEEQTLKSSKELLSITRALARAGRCAPVELSRAELRYALEERRVKSARVQFDQALNDVKNFLQLPGNMHLLLSTELQYEKFTWRLTDLIEYALAHRQDYLSARNSVEMQNLSLKDAKEANRPILSLISSYSKSRLLSNSSGPTNSYGWSVQALATWLLFDSGVSQMRVKQSQIDLANSKIALENTRQQIMTEVENAYLNIKNLEAQLRDFAFNRKQALNNRKAVQYRYSNGIDRLIDVFDAENDLRQLELEHLGLLVSYHSAKDQMALSINGRLPGEF